MHPKHANRLGSETSPYLLQHADNPVEWHPWGPEALELARKADKPVLLSIGYSACHWCHVMAHESFENEEIATQMNELFVNIKVDREERPDLDKIYQTAHQLLTQRPGGWPLTVFLDPSDKLPFFAGTYFPPRPAHGMPSFSELMTKVSEFYRNQRDDIELQKGPMTEVFRQIDHTNATSADLNEQPLIAVRNELEQAFDADNGGFGSAPKFPHPGGIQRLLHHWAASRNTGSADIRALHMATFSLESMIRGGIYDQLGGGFFRYSVDQLWRIPHFEKMLYDNGPLLALCAEAYSATSLEVFRRAARETAEWALREMQSEQGGFYSTLDADSGGREGAFYAWDASEFRSALSADDDLLSTHFGLDEPANFEGQHHLWQARTSAALASEHQLAEAALQDKIDQSRDRLFQLREKRVRPDRDEKILTAWNAMMIRGLAIAYRSTGDAKFADSAGRCLAFLRESVWQDSRLMATWKDGQARFPAYLDDYAFLIDAIVELLQCRWSSEDLNFAMQLADILLTHFADNEKGGFFFTADDHEALFHRSRPLSDDSTPSGNAIAARALLRLGFLLGETRYLEAAENTLRSAWDPMMQNSHAHTSMINTLAEFIEPPEILVLRGTDAKLEQWQQRLAKGYQPERLVFAIPTDASNLPEGLAIRAARGEIFAYLCKGHQCSAGKSLEELAATAN